MGARREAGPSETCIFIARVACSAVLRWAAVVAWAEEGRCNVLSGSGVRAARRLERAARSQPVEMESPTDNEQQGERSLQVSVLAAPESVDEDYSNYSVLSVLRVAANISGITVDLLRSRRRTRPLVEGRRLALLIWSRERRRPTLEMARALGLASSTAAQLIGTASVRSRVQAVRLALGLVERE